MEIKVVVRDSRDKDVALLVNKNDTIGSAKEKYCSKVGLENGIQWKYDGLILKDSDTFLSVGIENEDIISSSKRFKAGGGIDMADLSNEKGLVRRNYGKNALKWNKIIEGLNVDGICKNEKCEAYNHEVDCQIGMGTFDLVRDADRIKCPMCDSEIDPTTCVFCECEYKIEGKKKTNGKTEYVSTDWKRVEKDYEYYDPQKSGIVRWLMLIIETKSL